MTQSPSNHLLCTWKTWNVQLALNSWNRQISVSYYIEHTFIVKSLVHYTQCLQTFTIQAAPTQNLEIEKGNFLQYQSWCWKMARLILLSYNTNIFQTTRSNKITPKSNPMTQTGTISYTFSKVLLKKYIKISYEHRHY